MTEARAEVNLLAVHGTAGRSSEPWLLEEAPTVSSEALHAAVSANMRAGGRLVGLWGSPAEGGAVELTAVTAFDTAGRLMLLRAVATGGFPSLTPAVPAAQAFEREIFERFRLRLGHEEVPATLLTLSLAGRSRDENRFLTVLRERLSALQLVAPVASVGIEADEIQALAPSSRTLFGDAAEQRESCALLLERLRARLGQEAVLGVRAVPAHRPEFAWRETEPGARQRLESICGARPLWLLDPPQHLAARNGAPAWGGLLTLLAGPERIESGWWDGMDAARDYFIAAGTEGELLWLFRERRAPHGWYLHGLFA